MRRLAKTLIITGILACVATEAGCKKREPVRLQETDEAPTTLSSTVHAADPNTAVQLVRGFHGVEGNAWRWTMGKFSVTLKTPANASQNGARVVAKFSIPDAVINNVKTTTLAASVAGKEIGSASYERSGEYTFTADVPAELAKSDALTVDFALSNFLKPGTVDNRELGVVASMVALESK